jgi:hypothetical protein
MLPDNIEDLNYDALSEIEKMQFNVKLLNNYNRTMLQLLAGKNLGLAAIMSLSLAVQTMDSNKLPAVVEYVKLMFEAVEKQAKINQIAQQLKNEQAQKEKETTETIDEDGTINVDGKSN